EPEEPPDVANAWQDVDGALLALTEHVVEARDQTILEVHRVASRLRSIILTLPVPSRAYEQSLLASGTPEESCEVWSTQSLLQYVEARRVRMAALGEWEELLVSELLAGFHRLEGLVAETSPKQEALLATIKESLGRSRRVALVVNGEPFADALRWAITLPAPV